MPRAKSFGNIGCAKFSFPFIFSLKKKYNKKDPEKGVTENYWKLKAVRPKTKFPKREWNKMREK